MKQIMATTTENPFRRWNFFSETGQTLELGVHIEKFAELFEKDTGYFPEAATMLKAISTANNINASRSSVKLFKELMDKRVGPDVETYVPPEVLGEYGAKVR